jgi:hypothetical protein
LTDAADDGVGETEIELGLGWRMGEGDVDRLRLLAELRDDGANMTFATTVAVFVAETFENTFGRMTLFGRHRLVFDQVLLDER